MYTRAVSHKARVIKTRNASFYCSRIQTWVWKVTDAISWPSVSSINVMMSKDETHEEAQAKQQKSLKIDNSKETMK